MENLGHLNILRIPLQILWEFPDISAKIQEEDDIFRRDLTSWFDKYELSVQHDIRSQLEWALRHTDYDFRSVLKNVKTSNEDVVRYFKFLYNLIV